MSCSPTSSRTRCPRSSRASTGGGPSAGSCTGSTSRRRRRTPADWSRTTVAKDQNVRLRSGWFSERDACYLATGKPVVTQDTGFGAALPTGEGLFAFSTLDEAAAAIEAINRDYRRHCLAARRIAEESLDAPAVGRKLLADAGLA